MTPWLIFGAGGEGVGALIARLALAEGRSVVTLVRSDAAAAKLRAAGARAVTGDACDAQAAGEACRLAGREATVISTMGGSQDYLAHRTVIDCAEKVGISRMVLVTSLGCGESWVYLSDRAKAVFGQALREKSLAESWLQTSPLDFSIVRPGGLLHGEPTGKALLSQEPEVHGLVIRADVAVHVAGLAKASRLNRRVYGLVEPGLKPL